MMKTIPSSPTSKRSWHRLVALLCAGLLPGQAVLVAQSLPPVTMPPGQAAPTQPAAADAKRPPEQLESLVAPIALYPDPLLAQTLAASTYPLEMIQLQQWMAKNKNLKDKALADAVAKQPWDPAVQSMAAFPDAVKRLADDIQWTTDLGNAFLAQQSEVMDAVQRMRKKAKDNKALASNEQQKVETKVIETKEVIIIESANPQVIYVPSYNPTYVYGPYMYPMYPYPPVYYPPYTAGAAFMTFTMGVMIGAAWGGAWGHCGWGGSNTVVINNNNNFNKVNHNNVGSGNNNWQHNSNHRGGTPYGDKATANKYGGSSQRGGASAGTMDRGAGTGSRGGTSAGTMDRGGTGSRGGTSAGSMDRSAGGGGTDRVGSRDISSSSGSKGGGSFGGGSSNYSGRSAQTSSSRGASSSASRSGGGGASRGGGGRGGRR